MRVHDLHTTNRHPIKISTHSHTATDRFVNHFKTTPLSIRHSLSSAYYFLTPSRSLCATQPHTPPHAQPTACDIRPRYDITSHATAHSPNGPDRTTRLTRTRARALYTQPITAIQNVYTNSSPSLRVPRVRSLCLSLRPVPSCLCYAVCVVLSFPRAVVSAVMWRGRPVHRTL